MPEQLRKFIKEVRINAEIITYDEPTIEHYIITPILNHLGWYISNTDGIKLRYKVGTDKVDYALMVENKPRVFIEAKRGGLQFDIKEKKQVLNYADYQGVELAILTNGVSWDFYLPHHKGSWDERKFYNINIYKQDSDEIVSKFYDFLEKNNVGNGKAIENANITYETQKKEKIILETIPEAWNEIINEPHELLIELMKNTVEKICEFKPADEDIIKFLKTMKPSAISIKDKTPYIPYPLLQQKSNGKVEKITHKKLKDFIIELLYKSGKITRQKAMEKIYNKFENIFSQSWWQERDSTTLTRWQHRIDSIIVKMRKLEFVQDKDISGRSYWELTSKGIQLAKQLALQKSE